MNPQSERGESRSPQEKTTPGDEPAPQIWQDPKHHLVIGLIALLAALLFVFGRDRLPGEPPASPAPSPASQPEATPGKPTVPATGHLFPKRRSRPVGNRNHQPAVATASKTLNVPSLSLTPNLHVH